MFDFLNPKRHITLGTRDIHNHLLPGVDDGFRNAEDSIRAIQTMVQNGVREIVFTPHMNPDVYPSESESHFREVYADFKEKINCQLSIFHFPFSTALAAEYMVVKDFERRVTDHADELLTYPDGSILIEMSYMYRSRNFEDVIFELGMAGITPIVAHPERYLYMADQLGDFDHWVDMGAKLQMNYLSLTGQYGEASLKILRHLLKHGLYSFIATDLHSLSQLDRILTTKVDSKLIKQISTFTNQ